MRSPRFPARLGGGGCVLFILAVVIVMSHPQMAGAAKLEEGQKAVEFKATDFLTGSELDLKKHLGQRVILLDFGSIYCSSCMVTVPNLIKLRKKYSEDDLVIYNIYLDIYNPQRVVKFFMGFAKDIRLSLVIDEKLAVSREYGIDTLPTTVIIDRVGTIRRRIVGYTEVDEKEIDKIIENLVRELPLVGAEEWRAEQKITVFIPESFTKTVQDKVYVVGFIGGKGTKDVSLKLNNLPEKLSESKDNIFHFRTPLSLAMNLIEVKGQVEEGRVKSQSLVLFRETPLGDEIRSELPPYHFHQEEGKKPCLSCHELEIPLQDRTSLQQSEICMNCHSSLGKQIFTHGPITVGGCLPCHDYQSFPNKYELLSFGPDLCYTCHESTKATIQSGAFIHGPTAAGMCVVCHEPHGSSERYLLRKQTDRLCISCHQDVLREFSKSTLHRPLEEGNCTGCHDPHSSSDSKLLVLPREELCAKCHDLKITGHLHEIGSKAKTEFPPGTPLKKDGSTTCYSCHLFHASNLQKLWRGDKAGECGRGCHERIETEAGSP